MLPVPLPRQPVVISRVITVGATEDAELLEAIDDAGALFGVDDAPEVLLGVDDVLGVDDAAGVLAGVDEAWALLDVDEEAGALEPGGAELSGDELPGSEELVPTLELEGALESPPLPPQATRATDKQIEQKSG